MRLNHWLKAAARWLGVTSRHGGIAIQVTLLFTVILGFLGLGVEVVAMMMTKRQIQSAADSAAFASATALYKGYPVAFADEGTALLRAAGLVDGQAGTTIAINRPPGAGSQVGNNQAVEVVVTQQQNLALIPLFSKSAFALHVRAVAAIQNTGGACVLALDQTASPAVQASGNVVVKLDQCSVVSDSMATNSFNLNGGATFSASQLISSGNYQVSNNSTLTLTNGTQLNAPSTADPYTSRAVPSPSGQCLNPKSISSGPLPSGRYCSDISISTGTNVTLNGLYVLDGASFSMTGGSVSGNVSIVLTSSGSASKIGTVSISGNANLTLTALTTGATAGIVFFQDPRASASGTDTFNGGGTTTLTGALYFPNQAVKFGGSGTMTSTCTQLVARTITFNGNANLSQNCSGVGTSTIAQIAVKLVE